MITFNEVSERDLSILSNLYTIISFDSKPEENWTYCTSLSYLEYYYHYQPDLFICAYDDELPIGAIMSILKPSFDGIHLTQTELFVSEDLRGKNIGKQLLQKHFELAISKYHASYVDAITYKNNSNNFISWYKNIGLKVNDKLVILGGNLQDCLKNIN